MNSINVDHIQLTDFSGYLNKQGAGEFADIEDQIERALTNIQSNGWSDNKFEEFFGVFKKSKADIEAIVQLMQHYSSYLAQKAAKVGEYQNHSVF